MLNIAYNTTRLDTIIQDFWERQEYTNKRKRENRGKRATSGEINLAISEYLEGETVSQIAKRLYRSPSFVKNIIEKTGVPQRPHNAEERKEPLYFPEECVSDEFKKGQIVWSAKYHAPAQILDELSVDYQAEKPGYQDVNYEKKYSSKCYSIYVMSRVDQTSDFYIQAPDMGGFHAYALAYELGNLDHLEQHGIDLSRI